MTKQVTWYAAVPVAKRDDGWLACDDVAIECATADDAIRAAKERERKHGRSRYRARYYEAEIQARR